MNKPNTIEGVYDGLLESVRRVDNFPKEGVEVVSKPLEVKDIIDLIRDRIKDKQLEALDLSPFSDKVKICETYIPIETLEDLLEQINEKMKGEQVAK